MRVAGPGCRPSHRPAYRVSSFAASDPYRRRNSRPAARACPVLAQGHVHTTDLSAETTAPLHHQPPCRSTPPRCKGILLLQCTRNSILHHALQPKHTRCTRGVYLLAKSAPGQPRYSFPYWFYFLSTEKATLCVVASCLCSATRFNPGFVRFGPDLFEFLTGHFEALNWLFDNYSLDENDKRCDQR